MTVIEGAGAAATPVPVRETETLGRAGSLLAIVSVADLAPAAVGAKLTEMVCCAPGAMALARAPEMEKGAARPVSAVMLSAAVPVLLTVSEADLVWPTVTEPKSSEAATEMAGAAAVVGAPGMGSAGTRATSRTLGSMRAAPASG